MCLLRDNLHYFLPTMAKNDKCDHICTTVQVAATRWLVWLPVFVHLRKGHSLVIS